MKIFITGGNRLLGSYLLRELLKRNHELTVLVRNKNNIQTIENLKVEIKEGDLLDYNSLKEASKGAEAIFHLAANTSIWPSRDEKVRKVNIEGTRNMIKLAKELKVQKMVYVGTANSFSFGSMENPGVEDTPYLCARYGLDYMDSKYKAHQLVLSAVREGLPAVIVNPSFMLGAYDSTPSSGKLIMAAYNLKVLVYPRGGRNYICTKDAAVGVANALEKGRIGQAYIIGNENLNYRMLFSKILKVMGKKKPLVPISKGLMLIYGKLSVAIAKLGSKPPAFSYPMAQMANDEHYFSAQKAVKELDLPQTPIEEGIKECIDWFKENKYID